MYADELTPVGTAVRWSDQRYTILTNAFRDEDGQMTRIVRRVRPPQVVLWVSQSDLEVELSVSSVQSVAKKA